MDNEASTDLSEHVCKLNTSHYSETSHFKDTFCLRKIIFAFEINNSNTSNLETLVSLQWHIMWESRRIKSPEARFFQKLDQAR